MKGLWHTLAPFATDVSGACTVFQHANALVIAQDSNGAVSNLRRVLDLNMAAAAFETMDLADVFFTLGREEEFQARMHELLAIDNRSFMLFDPQMRGSHEFVVLVNGPVSNLLGADLALRSRLFEESTGLPTIRVQATGNKGYDKGISAAYDAMFERFVRPVLHDPPPLADVIDASSDRLPLDAPCANVIGLTELDWPGKYVFARLFESLRDAGERALCTFGYRPSDSIARWQCVPHAQRNIVASESGLKMARKLESELGAPYQTIDELDCFDAWTEGLHMEREPRVLVIGEHLSARVLRRLLLMMGAGQVDIATFFDLDRKLRRDGEMRLHGESDVRELLQRGEYDFVIGDSALEALSPVPFRALMHPPVGFGAREGGSLSRKWLEELCAWWKQGGRFAVDDAAFPEPAANQKDFGL